MSLPGETGADHESRGSGHLAPKEVVIRRAERASVSTHDLEALQRAVEWANFLNANSSGSDLLDPCCMLEALSDVYNAAHRLVGGSDQWPRGLAPGSEP